MGEPVALGVLTLSNPERYAKFYTNTPYMGMALYFAEIDMQMYPRVIIDGVTSDDYMFACSHLRYLMRSMPGSQVKHPNDLPHGVSFNPTDVEKEYLLMDNTLGSEVDDECRDGGYELFAEYLAWLSGVVGVTEIDEWFIKWNGDDPALAKHYSMIRLTGLRPEFGEYYRAGIFDDEVIEKMIAADVDLSLVSSLAKV